MTFSVLVWMIRMVGKFKIMFQVCYYWEFVGYQWWYLGENIYLGIISVEVTGEVVVGEVVQEKFVIRREYYQCLY